MSAPLPGAGAAETGFAAEIIRDLVLAHELATGFELCFLFGDRPRALAHVRERLRQARAAYPFHALEPSDDIVPALRALGEQITTETPRPIVWIQQATFDATTWRHVLSRLNQQRSWLRAHVPGMIVLAGPRALGEIASANAADFWSVRGPVRTVEGEPAAAPVRTGLRWLHVSDFHFRERVAWDQRPPLEALERWLHECMTRGERPDLVLVTGDIAWSGRDAEYRLAEDYFRRLADVCELDPRQRWFVVPGNHDVDRGQIRLADSRIIDGIADSDSLAQIQEDPETMRLLGRRLAGFYAFTERFLGPVRAWRIEAPWRSDVVDLDGLQIGVLQLNSTWAGGLEGDQGRLTLGAVQVRACLEMTRDAHLRIALMHHPLADLAAFDRDRASERLAAVDGADLVLRGHLHESQAVHHVPAHAGEPGGYWEIAAGAAYVRDRLYTGFQLGDIDMATGRATAQLLTYSDRGRGFWAPDARAYEHAPDGRLTMDLPRLRGRLATAADQVTAKPAADHVALDRAHRDHLIARYRQAAAAYHGTVRFLGMPRGTHGPHAHVEELFVPLGFVPLSGDSESQERMSTAELAARLVPQPGRVPGRFVVLGAPGSGKSTLCQYMAVLLAGEERQGDLAVPDDVLPLLIRLRDYVPELGRASDLGLLAFLELQARRDLSVPVPDGLLEERLAAGRAVLLLDGLDEVGSPEHRATLRDRVQAFCRAYPRVPTLVTSRIAGYDEAPLAPQAGEAPSRLDGFVHLRIAPFSDDDLRLFIDQWYEVQENGDARERRRKAATLQERLLAEPRARELARTPLLATLLALVHDAHGELPAERVRLYELCIETLLVTWPARRDRRFGDLDVALQQRYLETLALAVQWARGHRFPEDERETLGMALPVPSYLSLVEDFHAGTVMLTRPAMLDALVEILDARGPDGTRLRDLAARWLDFLEQGSEILQEQRWGMLGFGHLVLMEYLAARALQRAPQDRLVALVCRHFSNPSWREVCALIVAIHAEDRGFLDRLFEAATRERLPRQYFLWTFLLATLREEPDFHAEQREQILRGTAGHLVKTGGLAPLHGTLPDGIRDLPVDWEVHPVLHDVITFSHRHGAAAAQWLQHTLAHDRGEDLLGALALAPFMSSLARIQARPDRAAIAPRLLTLWPGMDLGAWAAESCQGDDALSWALTTAGEDLCLLRAIISLEEPAARVLVPALSVALARIAHSLVPWARDWLGRSRGPGDSEEPAPQALGLERTSTWRVPIEPRAPLSGVEVPRLEAPHWSPGLLRASISRRAHALGNGIAGALSPAVRSVFPESLSRVLGMEFHPTGLMAIPTLQGADGTRAFCSTFMAIFGQRGIDAASSDAAAESFARSFAPRLYRALPIPRPDQPRDFHAWLDPSTDFVSALMPLALEAYAALTVVNDPDTTERGEYLRHRVQHRFLLEMWSAWEATLPVELDAHRQALYLALGWTQCTVTATWPGTSRWTALLGGPPPAHWLARAHWHLCWLVYDPEDVAHLQGYRDALAEGRRDDELPGHADEMPGARM